MFGKKTQLSAVLLTLVAGLFTTSAGISHDHEGSLHDAFASAAVGGHRSEANQARNIYRHPAETLTFFGIEKGMAVLEISPGGGLSA